MADLIILGIVAHLVADWIFQNHWMATNKSSLTHLAAWTHGVIHFIAMLFVFTPLVALLIACTHMLIDTRRPIQWWQRVYKQTTDGVYAISVSIWLDQVSHIVVISFGAWLATRCLDK